MQSHAFGVFTDLCGRKLTYKKFQDRNKNLFRKAVPVFRFRDVLPDAMTLIRNIHIVSTTEHTSSLLVCWYIADLLI
jgi:hypothetical protein